MEKVDLLKSNLWSSAQSLVAMVLTLDCLPVFNLISSSSELILTSIDSQEWFFSENFTGYKLAVSSRSGTASEDVWSDIMNLLAIFIEND